MPAGPAYASRMFFVKFVVQLIDLHPGFVESLPAGGGDSVKPACPASGWTGKGFQQAGVFQAVQQRVKRAWPDPISVMRELLHHRHAEDWLVARMQEHMNPNQAVKELSLEIVHTNQYTAIAMTP
jgi:hypothetical protein